jgi:hypothetical protein
VELPVALRWWITIPALLWAAYYFVRARREGRYLAIAYLVIIAYGLLIESTDIRSTHGYDYAQLLFMIGSPPNWVPLSICVSWAAIIFIVMMTSDRLGLPWYQRPLVDGLIAVSTDLVGDPVFSNTRYVESLVQNCADSAGPLAGGIGVWTWCVPPNEPATWLTVPYDNFVGWFVVVAAMSFGIRLCREKWNAERRGALQQLLMLLAAAGGAAVSVFAILWVYMRVFNGPIAAPLVFALVLLGPLGLLALHARRLNIDNRFDLGIVLMPLFSLASGVFIFFQRAIDREHWPLWSVMIIAAALGSALLVLLPYLGTLRHGRGARQAVASSGSA